MLRIEVYKYMSVETGICPEAVSSVRGRCICTSTACMSLDRIITHVDTCVPQNESIANYQRDSHTFVEKGTNKGFG